MPAQAIKAMIGKVQATQPLTMASEPVSIFFSYSRKDEALMRELESHLEPLRLSRLIESWHDGCITPGEEWEPQIKENLQKAQIILLLISVNFISSRYCNTVELTQAIKRHKSGDALVIPLILKPCMWHPIPVGEMTLGELQALPKDALPVTSWKDPDEAYTNIAEGLYEKILQVQQELEQAEYAAKLKTYEQEFARAVQTEYPLSQQVIDQLKSVQQRLGLTNEAINPIEQPIREPAEAKYQQALAEAERQRQDAEAAQRRLREQEAAERKRKEAEAQRRQEEAERQRQRDEYYNGGIYHLNQGNLDQAIADLTQAKQLGHPKAAQKLAEAQQQKQATEDDLSSEKGIDYTRLRDLLKAQDWKTADQETYKVMIRAVGKKSDDLFTNKELLNFPCTDLLTIDRLWVKYSQGHFGFSVQQQIHVECGAKPNYEYPDPARWNKFGDKVGWRVNGSWIYYDEVTFRSSAPKGYFPAVTYRFVGVTGTNHDLGTSYCHFKFLNLASRLVKCKP